MRDPFILGSKNILTPANKDFSDVPTVLKAHAVGTGKTFHLQFTVLQCNFFYRLSAVFLATALDRSLSLTITMTASRSR